MLVSYLKKKANNICDNRIDNKAKDIVKYILDNF